MQRRRIAEAIADNQLKVLVDRATWRSLNSWSPRESGMEHHTLLVTGTDRRPYLVEVRLSRASAEAWRCQVHVLALGWGYGWTVGRTAVVLPPLARDGGTPGATSDRAWPLNGTRPRRYPGAW
jgi:hypothetical protein